VATSFGTDPLAWAIDTANAFRNIRYGPSIHHRLNVYLNENRLPGGNPVLVYTHGGGWSTNEKTSTVEGSELQRLLWAYLLGSDTYGTDEVPFDVVSVEWRRANQTNISPGALNTPYEATAEGTNPGTGPTSAPWFFPTWVDDQQRAIQFVKANAGRFGFDPLKIVAWGSSSGAHLALLGGLSPSRRFLPADMASRLYDATWNSRVRGVLNWYGPINFSPWYLHFKLLAPAFGLVENSDTNQRADMERLLLVPDSSGAYPSTVDVTPLCKSVSPVYRIRAAWPENAAVRIRSQYATYDTTTVPGSTYSTIPPYVATGHDYAQLADLAAECTAVGVPHSSGLVDASLFGGDVQLAWESTLADTYAWLQTCVDF